MSQDVEADLLNKFHGAVDRLRNIAAQLQIAAREVPARGHLDTIRFYHKFDQAFEALSEMKKSLNETSDFLSRDTIPELMREAGVKTITVEGVGRVTVSHRFSCSIIDKALGYQWLRDHNLGDIITETVNSSTMAATARNLLEKEGRELPPEIFKTGTSPYTSITKK
jgi:hypothetical protein